MTDTNQPCVVDNHFRPFVRALGNLVITFALCEARLLEFVSEMLGGDELKAVALLKSPSAKKDVLCLAKTIGLSGFDREDLLEKVESFWEDKAVRNRFVHDEWFPSSFEPNPHLTDQAHASRAHDQLRHIHGGKDAQRSRVVAAARPFSPMPGELPLQ